MFTTKGVKYEFYHEIHHEGGLGIKIHFYQFIFVNELYVGS